MKATCPTNPEHKEFITVAHVSQDWKVDDEGNFLEVSGPDAVDTVAGPHSGNSWECTECGAEANVTD